MRNLALRFAPSCITVAALALGMCSALVGCGGASVRVEGDFPAPLVERLPLRIGLYLDPALTDYKHVEEIDQMGTWEVELGSVQPRLFRTVADAMFASVSEVPSPSAAGPNLDAVLAPAIEEFQMTIPAQTRSNFYEVWIKYQMSLYEPGGELIARWPLTAYGKANREDYGMFESEGDQAVREATMSALRDAGAFLSLRFSRVPKVKAWLDTKGGESDGAPDGLPSGPGGLPGVEVGEHEGVSPGVPPAQASKTEEDRT